MLLEIYSSRRCAYSRAPPLTETCVRRTARLRSVGSTIGALLVSVSSRPNEGRRRWPRWRAGLETPPLFSRGCRSPASCRERRRGRTRATLGHTSPARALLKERRVPARKPRVRLRWETRRLLALKGREEACRGAAAIRCERELEVPARLVRAATRVDLELVEDRKRGGQEYRDGRRVLDLRQHGLERAEKVHARSLRCAGRGPDESGCERDGEDPHGAASLA